MAHALRYPASRYRTETPPDLGTRAARERLSGPGLKAFFNIAARWKVRDEDARALLGGVTNGPFYEMKRKPDRMLDTDRLTRISYLIGIFKALHILHSRKARRRVGAPAEQQSDFQRRDAARLHDPRRVARHADRAPPARRAPRGMMLPPVTLVREFDTHRLVLSRHLPQGDSVLVAISDDDAHLQAIFELDTATNDRLLAGQQLLPGIGVEELVFGVPHAAVINAAFCHPHPLGSRFNGPSRGAWYAAFAIETSQAEVGFHKSVQLAEIGRFEDTVTYDDYMADFSADFTTFDRRRPRCAHVSRSRYAMSSLRRWPNVCWRRNLSV